MSWILRGVIAISEGVRWLDQGKGRLGSIGRAYPATLWTHDVVRMLSSAIRASDDCLPSLFTHAAECCCKLVWRRVGCDGPVPFVGEPTSTAQALQDPAAITTDCRISSVREPHSGRIPFQAH